MTRTRVPRWRWIVVAVVAAIACSDKQEAPKVPLGQRTTADSIRAIQVAHGLLGPEAKAALDSGNALYRKKDYAAALAQYRAASALAPQHAAPIFGIYMVARATNNVAMADSALAGIRSRNGPLPTLPHTTSDSVLQRVHQGIQTKPSSG